MENKRKAILNAAAVAAAAAAAASLTAYATTRYLLRIALDRKEPPAVKTATRLISRSQAESEFSAAAKAAAEALRERENEVVEITAQDGERLIGHWRPQEHPRRVIIAMHGWRSAWYKDFGMVADFWERNGCSVLYAEQRGQNNSGGEYMGFGLTERYDCLDWVRWVTERCGGDIPVYLCGLSMGATTVLMAAGLALPENVHGIMADCGFTSPHDIWKHIANNNLHLSYGLMGNIADALMKRKLQVSSDEYSTLEAMESCTVPVMLVHGEDDHFVPVSMTYENYAACAAPKRLLIVPGADHGMSYYLAKEEYEAAALDFWKTFD